MTTNGNGSGQNSVAGSNSSSNLVSSPSFLSPSPLSFSSLSSYIASRYLFSRYNGLTGFNTQYGGRRDLNLVLGYDDYIDAAMYRYEYERGGLAERIVKIFPKATWGNRFDIKDDPNLKFKTKFERGVEELYRSLNIHSKLYRATVLAYLNHFSILLIGAPGDPSEPLPSYRQGGGEITYLHPYGEDKVKIIELVGQSGQEEDRYNKRFGLPLYYQINPNGFTVSQQSNVIPVNSSSSTSFERVHWSRVIHLVRSPLDNDIVGEPILRSVWNLLHDLKKETGGVAEADLRRAWPKFHANYDINAKEVGKAERDSVKENLENLDIGLENSVRSRGMSLTPLSTGGKIGMKENVEAIIQQIAGTISAPFRSFIGAEQAVLASKTDKSNFNDRVMELRATENEPIAREFFGRLVEYGYLPPPKNPYYEIIWPEEEELSEIEKAQTAKAMRDSGCFNEEEIRDRIYGMGPRVIKDPIIKPTDKGVIDPNKPENDENKQNEETVQ